MKLKCDSVDHIAEPSRTYVIRNIMINTIRKLTPSVLNKLNELKLYELYKLVNDISGKEAEVVLVDKDEGGKINE